MADERDAVATRPDSSAAGKPPKPAKSARPPKPPKAPKPPKVKVEKPATSPKPPKPPKTAKPPKATKVTKVRTEKPAKPKADKPARADRGRSSMRAARSDREPLAPIAFVASLLSATTAGVAAVPALLLARKAKREIAARPGATGRGLARAATAIAVLSLVGWASFGAFTVARAIRPSGVDYATLKVGDCIVTPGGDQVRRVHVVSCNGPHDAEVFAVATHPAPSTEAFPGVPALLDFAADACLGQAFVDYVGVPRIRSQLTDYEFVPGEQGWSQGRRDLVCVVDSSDGQPLTGSVKASRR
jgi:hypothetical protein